MLNNKMLRKVTWTFFSLTIFSGTYNAIVINTDSQIVGTEIKFVKRLDEIYGVTESGRLVASTMPLRKMSLPKVVVKSVEKTKPFFPTFKVEERAPEVIEELIPNAAIQEELSLSLVEVINPKKFPTPLTSAQFSGSLSTNNGVIEDLNISLPNDEGIAFPHAKMVGNVFEYDDQSGDRNSGMMYQIDQNSYMVTITNGPHEGTRLRFAAQNNFSDQSDVFSGDTLATTENTTPNPMGYYDENTIASNNIQDQAAQQDQQMQQEAIEAQNLQQPNTLEAL